MDRRSFFRLLAGAAATPAVTYVLPPPCGWTLTNGVYRTGTIGDEIGWTWYDPKFFIPLTKFQLEIMKKINAMMAIPPGTLDRARYTGESR